LTRQTPLPQQTSAGSARQAPLAQGAKPVPRQTQTPFEKSPVASGWQNCALGQQTRSGPHGGSSEFAQRQKGEAPVPGLWQLEPAGQAKPHTPQLLSVVRSVQAPLQQPRPGPQACPQAPQLLASVWVLTQAPAQTIVAFVPGGQQTLVARVPSA
jgi:hypothetical protein